MQEPTEHPLEPIIRENTGWLYRFLRSRTGDRETAEDLTQEVWLRVFRSFENYQETGHLRAWLGRIARNVYYSWLTKGEPFVCLSLDGEDEETEALANVLTDGVTAEDVVLEKSLTEEMLSALARLPDRQRQVLTCRYLWDMTVPQVAKALDMAPGTVKSSTHYGLASLRKTLGVAETSKGDNRMDCKETREYIYMYALGKLPEDVRGTVEAHLASCDDCKKIAEALAKLIPQMAPVDEGCTNHWTIDFPAERMGYTFIGSAVENADWMSEKLTQWGGGIPGDYTWFGSGFSDILTPGKKFDNEGDEVSFTLSSPQPGFVSCRITGMKRVYPFQRMYDSNFYKDGYWGYVRQEEDGRYVGHMHNNFGNAVKSGQYQMIPKAAKNIRIEQGNGVLDCGSYWAVYADRYCGENEGIALHYTFTM